MICGNCKVNHETAAQVKTCFGLSGNLPQVALPAPSADELRRAAEQSASQTVAKPLSEKAANLLGALVRSSLLANGMDHSLIEVAVASEVAKGDSRDIDDYKARGVQPVWQLPVTAQSEPATAALKDGIYLKDDVIYKVVHAVHGSGKQYAKRLVAAGTSKPSFEYDRRAILRRLTEQDRLTKEKAKEFGLLYGVCVNCLATLTREESIHVGYGPICARNNGWYYPTKKELQIMADNAPEVKV